MRITHFICRFQYLLLPGLLFASLSFFSCNRASNDIPVLPPATHPLTRDYIGFGVVNVSFAHVLSEPGAAGVSQGYLRRGTVVRILERRQLNNRGSSELWILAEGNYLGNSSVSRGWLEEATLEIYDSERRAITASRGLSQ